MKKDFLQRILDMLKKTSINKAENQFNGYNVNPSNTDFENRRESRVNASSVPENGYLRLTGDKLEVITKEQAVAEVYNYIQRFLNNNQQIVSNCTVTEKEWKIFLETAYDQFALYQLQSGFSSIMRTSINYIFYERFLYESPKVTFQDVLERFNIDYLPAGIANGMVESIKKTVYLNTREDNVVNFLEYQKISR